MKLPPALRNVYQKDSNYVAAAHRCKPAQTETSILPSSVGWQMERLIKSWLRPVSRSMFLESPATLIRLKPKLELAEVDMGPVEAQAVAAVAAGDAMRSYLTTATSSSWTCQGKLLNVCARYAMLSVIQLGNEATGTRIPAKSQECGSDCSFGLSPVLHCNTSLYHVRWSNTTCVGYQDVCVSA